MTPAITSVELFDVVFLFLGFGATGISDVSASNLTSFGLLTFLLNKDVIVF